MICREIAHIGGKGLLGLFIQVVNLNASEFCSEEDEIPFNINGCRVVVFSTKFTFLVANKLKPFRLYVKFVESVL